MLIRQLSDIVVSQFLVYHVGSHARQVTWYRVSMTGGVYRDLEVQRVRLLLITVASWERGDLAVPKVVEISGILFGDVFITILINATVLLLISM